MEQIVFPVPNICEFLTRESKCRVFNTTERDEQGSKVNDFFQQSEDLYNEMKWQKKIRSKYIESKWWALCIMVINRYFGAHDANSFEFFLISRPSDMTEITCKSKSVSSVYKRRCGTCSLMKTEKTLNNDIACWQGTYFYPFLPRIETLWIFS